jgi:hypothetical protein
MSTKRIEVTMGSDITPKAGRLKGWLFYPHDGELENGGVYVHPTDKSHIWLLVKNRLIRVEGCRDGDANDTARQRMKEMEPK